MTRKQSLKKLEQAVKEKVADLIIGPDDEVSPFMPDHLRELALASRRINEGGYGTCVDCSSSIPLARLQVKPEAVRCVRCQSSHEHAPAVGGYRINPHVRSAS